VIDDRRTLVLGLALGQRVEASKERHQRADRRVRRRNGCWVTDLACRTATEAGPMPQHA
jgi:hypothetical protein